MAKIRLPKVGDVVGILWLDSGKNYSGTEDDAKKEVLAECEVFGRVKDVSDKRILLATDTCTNDSDRENDSWEMVWIPAILKVTVYTPKGQK